MSDRGVSISVNYVLTLAITTLLMTGLLFATGNLVEDRRDSATRSELRVVGERVASSLMTADRLAQTGSTKVVVQTDAPAQIAGSRYTVSLNASNQRVVIVAEKTGVTTRIPFENETAISDSNASGGGVRIVLANPGGPNEALEVQSS